MPIQMRGRSAHDATGSDAPVKRRRKNARMMIASGTLFILVFILGGYTNNLIPSGSMEPTLMPGDHIVVMRSWLAYPFGRLPERGDIITFHPPKSAHLDDGPGSSDSSTADASTDQSRSRLTVPRKPKREILIKRVIGLPGDTVQIIAGVVTVNGKPLNENYHTTPEEDPGNADYPYAGATPLTVAQGHLFVLGDNRSNSDDGRFWGTLERNEVVGKYVRVLFHENEIAQ